MPVKIRKISKGKYKGKYKVSTPGGTKAKHATKENALAQERLINMREHGIVPKGGWKNK